ncbi:hypothetical protein EMCRGX_G031290 [Ephydatia muelleri]
MEGKEANRRKDFSQEYGEGTAVTLRLTKEYYGTGRAYVQKGVNDICDDGKEIAEAEDWESTVKENR